MTWLIYDGSGRPHDGISRLPVPPPWRVFDGGPVLPLPRTAGASAQRRAQQHQAVAYQPSRRPSSWSTPRCICAGRCW